MPDMVSQRWVAPQPDDPPCPGCTFVPPPNAMSPTSDYVLVFQVADTAAGSEGVNPEWQPPSTPLLIQSAAVEIKRYNTDGTFDKTTRLIDPSDLIAVLGWSGPGPFRLLLNGIGPLAGCTASINFTVRSAGGITYSVQNPVYVDP